MVPWTTRSGRTPATRTSSSRTTCSPPACPPSSPSGCRGASRTTTGGTRRSTSTARSSAARMPQGRTMLTDENGRTVVERGPGRQRQAAAPASISTRRASGPSSCTRRSASGWRRSRIPSCSPPAARAINDWAHRVPASSSRATCAPRRSRCSTPNTPWPRSQRAAGLGFHAAYLSVTPGARRARLERPTAGSPLWAALEETGLVVAFHIGTEAARRQRRSTAAYFRGPGGALINYVETTYGGQRAVTKMIAVGRVRPPPGLQGDGVRGRGDVGAVRRRPSRRGATASTASAVRAAAASGCRASTSTRTSTPRSSTTGRRSRR